MACLLPLPFNQHVQQSAPTPAIPQVQSTNASVSSNKKILRPPARGNPPRSWSNPWSKAAGMIPNRAAGCAVSGIGAQPRDAIDCRRSRDPALAAPALSLHVTQEGVQPRLSWPSPGPDRRLPAHGGHPRPPKSVRCLPRGLCGVRKPSSTVTVSPAATRCAAAALASVNSCKSPADAPAKPCKPRSGGNWDNFGRCRTSVTSARWVWWRRSRARGRLAHPQTTFALREQAGIRVCDALARRGVLTRPITCIRGGAHAALLCQSQTNPADGPRPGGIYSRSALPIGERVDRCGFQKVVWEDASAEVLRIPRQSAPSL